MSVMGVTDQLRRTNKGRLSYERGSNIKELLDQCSSPPPLNVSPRFATNQEQQAEEKKDNEPENTDKLKDDGDRAKKKLPSTIVSPEYVQSRLALQKYEITLDNRAREARLRKQKEFEDHVSQAKAYAEEEQKRITNQLLQNETLKHEALSRHHNQRAEEIKREHLTLKRHHEERKQVQETRVQEAELTKQRLIEEQRRKREHTLRRTNSMSKSLAELKVLAEKLTGLYEKCPYKSHVSEGGKKSISLMRTLTENAEKVYQHCAEVEEVSNENVEKFKGILEQAGNAYEFVKNQLVEAEKSGKEAQRAAQAVGAAQGQTQPPVSTAASEAQVSPGTPLATSTPMPEAAGARPKTGQGASLTTAAKAATEGEALCTDIEAYQEYERLQKHLAEVEKSFQGLSTPQYKKLKFDYQKAVNIPVNAISPVSGEHLRDKLQRLLILLSGQIVEVSNKRVSTQNHPEAATFCKHLICKMIVKKGEEQVSVKHETAFAIAMVTVGLLCEHSDMKDILLGHFHLMCPYIVPYYHPREEGMSSEDYHKSLGYRYEDRTVEKQDKFLRRMSGLMRLYCSIMVSPPLRLNLPHPYGIENAWIWLARVMNIEPFPDITATLMYDLLQVTGHALCKIYGKQFLKMLHILVKEFLPKLKRVASEGGGGPVARLELFLETSIRNQGNIPPPEGLLHHRFWTS